MKCRACGRTAWHWDWFQPVRFARAHMVAPTCSPHCLQVWKDIRTMVDPNHYELAAMAAASDCAGEYIESLGRTDMALWTPEEWASFIEAVCGGYVDSLVRQQAEAMEALARVQAVPA